LGTKKKKKKKKKKEKEKRKRKVGMEFMIFSSVWALPCLP
jgi:hypothetical protein